MLALGSLAPPASPTATLPAFPSWPAPATAAFAIAPLAPRRRFRFLGGGRSFYQVQRRRFFRTSGRRAGGKPQQVCLFALLDQLDEVGVMRLPQQALEP